MKRAVVILIFAFLAVPLAAQQERQIQRPADQEYGERFFEQLRRLFGQFRDADLNRAFQEAEPIQCSELISGAGEWREVAFFNDDRRLGASYRATLQEVKESLALYLFKGLCRSDESSIRLTTKFPVRESLDRYVSGRIHLSDVVLNVNDSVVASFDPIATAYTFKLPFLYSVWSSEVGRNVYSLEPEHLSDRYDPGVVSQWSCKAVFATDVTYRFLVCRTSLVAAKPDRRDASRRPEFGSSAYIILSDGKEAGSKIRLTLDSDVPEDSADESGKAARTAVPPNPPSAPPHRTEPEAIPTADSRDWTLPAPALRLVDLSRTGFRILFSRQTWLGRFSTKQILVDQLLTNGASVSVGEGSDYCVWTPSSPGVEQLLLHAEREGGIDYEMTSNPSPASSVAEIRFDMKLRGRGSVGSLQCFFPRVSDLSSITVERWVSTVGAHVTLQVLVP